MSQVDYSGQWQFSPRASSLQIAAPDAVAFTIEHRKPSFRLERTLTFDARRDTFAIDLTLGANGALLTRGDAIVYPSIRWDGDQLVFFTRIVRADEESTNLVRNYLEGGGTILVAEESFRSPAQSGWPMGLHEGRGDTWRGLTTVCSGRSAARPAAEPER